MLDRLFQFLFKYRPVVFERGQFTFAVPWPFWIVAACAVVAGGLAVLLYVRTRGKVARRDRVMLLSLRLAALGIITFCLAGPALMIATVVPQQNFIGVLVDDSRSMRIRDQDGRRRGDIAAEALDPEGPLLAGLSSRFKVRLFRFSESVERLNDAGELTYAGRRTDLAHALSAVQRELSAVPLAGIVVLTDGGENSGNPLTEPLLELQASHVPVHVIGLGRERFERDIQIGRVETPRTVLEGTSVGVEISVRHSGFGGRTVQLNVEDAGRILSTHEFRLPREGEMTTVQATFTVTEPGPRLFRFVIPLQPDEMISENNAVEALIVVERRREKILYFEGEPRFEVKFLRRAIADDANLHVVTLQRTAENKFLRLDVEDSTELVAGFPRTREELFRYRALILGSVEASFFTRDQLRMIAEFVSMRGGGLLALGGRSAFAEGGYTETPLADVLPVILEPPSHADSTPFFAEVKVGLTPFGRSHPVMQLRPTPAASKARWDSLPPLSVVNPIHAVKPGASTWLTGSNGDDTYVVLASQRYGRGKAVAFPVQDSWIWQMHADIPLEDMTHETLWRQLLRWLVAGVADQVMVTTSDDRIDVGRDVTVTAEVADSGYLRLNGAEVTATIIDPTGEELILPMQWTVERDGEYRTRFAPAMAGLHEIRVTARRDDRALGVATSYVLAGDVDAEFFGAEMRESLLRRVAEETGGRFYTPETMASLPEDVSFTESGVTVYEQRDLWDMPILLLLLLGFIGAEWGYRRYLGLA